MEPVRMIFADPPDNIGLGYGQYDDKLFAQEYTEVMDLMIHLSVAHADIVWISYNPVNAFLMGHLLHCFLEKHDDWQGKHCVQTFTFGQHNCRDLGINHRLLVRLMRKGTLLYPNAVRVPSWRQQHGDKRADPRGRVPGDVMHVEQYTRNTLPLPNLSIDDFQRIISKIRMVGSDDCWEWEGYKREGYGRVRIGGRKGKLYGVTRLIWRLVHGTDPVDQIILHTCDNPSCCNPAHLFLGLDTDNSDDKIRKNRQYRPKGELNVNTKLTEKDVINIYHASGTYVSIAKDYGISDVSVRNIKTSKTWTHVTGELELSDVFNLPRVTGNSKQRRRWCPTQLHEGLYERCIRLCCAPDDTVCDIFAGTGTLARVCKRTKNPCILIESDYEYCMEIAKEHNLVKQQFDDGRLYEWKTKQGEKNE